MEDPVCISFSMSDPLSLDVTSQVSLSQVSSWDQRDDGLFTFSLSLLVMSFFEAVAPHFSFSTSFTFSFSLQVLIMTKMKKNKRRQRTRRRDDWLTLSLSFHLRWKNPSLRILIDHTLLWFPLFFPRCSCLFSFIASSTSSSPASLSLFFLFLFPDSFLFNYFSSLTSRSWDTHIHRSIHL